MTLVGVISLLVVFLRPGGIDPLFKSLDSESDHFPARQSCSTLCSSKPKLTLPIPRLDLEHAPQPRTA